MKTSLLYPQSFFARTLWMVLLAVLFSKALTLIYLMLNEDVLVDQLIRIQRLFFTPFTAKYQPSEINTRMTMLFNA